VIRIERCRVAARSNPEASISKKLASIGTDCDWGVHSGFCWVLVTAWPRRAAAACSGSCTWRFFAKVYIQPIMSLTA